MLPLLEPAACPMGDPARHPAREGADGGARQGAGAACRQAGDWRDWHERLSGPDAVAAIERWCRTRASARRAARPCCCRSTSSRNASRRRPRPSAPPSSELLQAAFARDLPFMVIATGRSDVLEGLIEVERTGRPLRDLPAHRDAARALSAADRGAGCGRRHHGREGPVGAHRRDVESKEALPLLAHMLALLYQRGGETTSSISPNTKRSAIRRAVSTRSRIRSGSPPTRRSPAEARTSASLTPCATPSCRISCGCGSTTASACARPRGAPNFRRRRCG